MVPARTVADANIDIISNVDVAVVNGPPIAAADNRAIAVTGSIPVAGPVSITRSIPIAWPIRESLPFTATARSRSSTGTTTRTIDAGELLARATTAGSRSTTRPIDARELLACTATTGPSSAADAGTVSASGAITAANCWAITARSWASDAAARSVAARSR